MSDAVRCLLEGWGFADFVATFEREGIDSIDGVLSLTMDELKSDLGMSRLGDRKRFLGLCAGFSSSSSSSSEQLTSSSPAEQLASASSLSPMEQRVSTPDGQPSSLPVVEQHSSTPLPVVEQYSSTPLPVVEQHISTPLPAVEQHSSTPSSSPVAQEITTVEQPLSTPSSLPLEQPSQAPAEQASTPPTAVHSTGYQPFEVNTDEQPAATGYQPFEVSVDEQPAAATTPPQRVDSPGSVLASVFSADAPAAHREVFSPADADSGNYAPLLPSFYSDISPPAAVSLSPPVLPAAASSAPLPAFAPLADSTNYADITATASTTIARPVASVGYVYTATVDSVDSTFDASMTANYSSTVAPNYAPTTAVTYAAVPAPRASSPPSERKSKKQVVDAAMQSGAVVWIQYNGGTAPLIWRPIKPLGYEQSAAGLKLKALCMQENLPKTFVWAKIFNVDAQPPSDGPSIDSDEPLTDYYFDENSVKRAQECVKKLSNSAHFSLLGLGKSVAAEEVIEVFAAAIAAGLPVRQLVLAIRDQLLSPSLSEAAFNSQQLVCLDTPTGYLNQDDANMLLEWVHGVPNLKKIRIRCSMSQSAREELNEALDERRISVVAHTSTNFSQHSPIVTMSSSHPVPLSPSRLNAGGHSSASTPTELPRSASSGSSTVRRSHSRSPLSPDSGAVLLCVAEGFDLKLRPVWIGDASVPFNQTLNVQAKLPERREGNYYRVESISYQAAKTATGKGFYRAVGAIHSLGTDWRPPSAATPPAPLQSSSHSPAPTQSPPSPHSSTSPPAHSSLAHSSPAHSSASAPAHSSPVHSSPVQTAVYSSASSSAGHVAGAVRSVREIPYGELRLERDPIGKGAYGVVYRGTWRGATVAVKKLIIDGLFDGDEAKILDEFRSEIAVMSRIDDHPNVIRLLGICSAPPNLCLVTPWVAYGSLEDLLFKPREPPVQLTLKVLVRIARDIAAGILHLHLDGIIHRDLALRNVLIGDSYSVYVNDFGLSRFKNQGDTYAKTKSSFGPVKNMAPEAIMEKKYSEKSDAYSFGILLWQMLTRRQPYDDMDAMQVVVYVARERHLPRLDIPADTHPALVELFEQCTSLDPAARPTFTQISQSLQLLYIRLPADA